LRTAFGLLDRNRDGRVTASELQFMLQNLGIQVRDELINDLINEASHSGKARTYSKAVTDSIVSPVLSFRINYTNKEHLTHDAGFLGWRISPSQILYLHRITQHRETQTHIHKLNKHLNP
jgi:hypothetical protein